MANAQRIAPREFEQLDAPSGRGQLFRRNAFQSRLGARDIYVWTPDTAPKEALLPVIYMQDGQNLFDPNLVPFGDAWRVDDCVSRLVDAKLIPPAIVVGVASTAARLQEFAPALIIDRLSPQSRRLVEAAFGGPSLSLEYARLLVDEIKPLVESNFSVLRGREGAYLVGSSMGAVVAAEIYARNPETFSGVGCLSAHFCLLPLDESSDVAPDFKTNVGEAVFAFARDSFPKAEGRRVWIDRSEFGVDRFYEPTHAQFCAGLSRNGYREQTDLTSRFYPGVAHNESAWRARIGDALQFLMANKPLAGARV